MAKHSIFLDKGSEILLENIRENENLSKFFQRLIKEEAERKGYTIKTMIYKYDTRGNVETYEI